MVIDAIVYASEHYFSIIRGLAIAALLWMLINEAHIGQFLWKQGLQSEYSVLLSPVLQ
jgi:hypothetical protein